VGRVQQLPAGGSLVEPAERIARLVEEFRAAGVPCGLLGLPRLARSVGEQIVFRPPTRLREAMALRFRLHAGLRAQWKGMARLVGATGGTEICRREGGCPHSQFFRHESLARELCAREYWRHKLRSSRRIAGRWFEFGREGRRKSRPPLAPRFCSSYARKGPSGSQRRRSKG